MRIETSGNLDNAALTMDRLRQLAPAAFSEHHHMSRRYGQVPTIEVVRQLAKEGYLPVSASQERSRLRDKSQVIHRITLRHEDVINAGANLRKVGDEVPQISIVNSHNGRTKLKLFAGLFRLVCANGLIVGDTRWAHSIAHDSDAVESALHYARQFGVQLGQLQSVIERWSQIELSREQVNMFARAAAALRFGEIPAKAYEPAALLEARREEDAGRSLWKVFNVVQENAVRGGISGRNSQNRTVKSRALNAINADIAFNSQLWQLANTYAAGARH